MKFRSLPKQVVIMALFVAMTLTAGAHPVDITKARQVGAKFLNGSTTVKVSDADLQCVQTYRMEDGTPAFYVFNTLSGYVIVSADDCAFPILGYSEKAPFAKENIPVQMASYLQGFVEQIQYGVTNRLVADEATAHQWELVQSYGRIKDQRNVTVVQPLVTAQWGQGQFYNSFCPEDASSTNGHALVGCVAVAMGQIMHYWGYPINGTGSHSYLPISSSTFEPSGYPQQTADFGATTYQWANMPNELNGSSSTAQVNAVATLLWHCGVSVEMMYGVSGSGAYSGSVPMALQGYFNYSSDMQGINRYDYSSAQWLSLVKASLDMNRPVYYSGSDTQGLGGHAFVCDGYDANDLLHFNWGWYGNHDDYFADGALNVSQYQFNESNFAIVNIHPECTIGTSFQINASSSNAAAGTVAGAGTFSCSTGCTLTAIPNSGYVFCSWTENGTMVSLDPSYSFSVTRSRNLVANFIDSSAPMCSVVFQLNDSFGDGWNGNALTVSYSEGCFSNEQLTLEGGSNVTITRNVLDGSHVVLGWVSGSWPEECSFTVSYDNGTVIYEGSNPSSSFSYEFDVNCGGSLPTYHSIAASANPVYGGIVTGGGNYAQGATCFLTATPNTGYTFSHWTKNGTVLSDGASFSFVVTEDATFVAYFTGSGSNQVVATYYPDENDPQSPYAKVSWELVKELPSADDACTDPVKGSRVAWDFESDMSGWTPIDANNDGITWVDLDHIGDITDYYSGMTLDWYHGGSNAVISGSYYNGIGALEPDDYLVSPLVSIDNGSLFSFWVAACDASYPSDHFGVFVSTGSPSNPADFNSIQEWTLTAKKPASVGNREVSRDGKGVAVATWYNYSVDLSAYAGQQVYIAFRHFNCTDQYIMTIDDAELTGGGGPTPPDSVASYRIYRKDCGDPTPPNPGTGQWYYYDDGNQLESIGTGGGQFYWGVMFPAGSYSGDLVTKVSAYDVTAMSGMVTLYNDGASAPSNQVGSRSVSFDGSGGFVEFVFEQPVVVNPNKNLWVVFSNDSGAAYPAACCTDTGDPNGRWVSLDGSTWVDMYTGYDLAYTFMVRAYVAQASKPSDPVLIASGVQQSPYIDYSWADLADGSYQYGVSGVSESGVESDVYWSNCLSKGVSYTITVAANPTSGGTVTGGGTFSQGAICSLTATANAGYAFSHWTKNGTVLPYGGSFSFAVTESASYVAYFTTTGGSAGELGYTVYDWQSNCGARTWTHVWPDGKVNFAFTQANNTNYSDRGTGIGTYDAFTDGWIASPGRVENEKTGFGTIAQYGANGLVVASHTAEECCVYIIPDKDNITPGSLSRVSALSPTHSPCWPNVMTSGPDRNIIHVIATGSSDNKMYYFRSSNGGQNWDKQNVTLPYMSSSYGTYWNSNSCYWMETTDDNCLALVVNNAWSDGMVIYSYDDGETWQRKVFYKHPNPAGDFSDTWFFYPRWTSCQWGPNGELCVLYEFNATTGTVGSGSFYPSIGGVAYWSETLPYNANGTTVSAIAGNLTPGQPFVMDSAYLRNDIYSSWWLFSDALHGMWPEYVGYLPPLTDNGDPQDPYDVVEFNIDDRSLHGSYNSGVCGFPVLCRVPGSGELVAVWSAMDENHTDSNGNYYYKLFARYSPDAGMTWSDMVSLTNDASFNNMEFVYNQAAVVGRRLIVASQVDGTTGTFVQSDDGNAFDNHYMGLVFDIDVLFNATQPQQYSITVSADPANGGTVSGGGTYNQGAVCHLEASANPGYDFSYWTKNGSVLPNGASFSFNVTESANYVAHFTQQAINYTITVSADPANGGTVSGGGTYAQGAVCHLEASANPGYVFQNWTKNGTVLPNGASFSFNVTESATYVAHFSLATYSVTVSAEPVEGGVVSGTGTYQHGSTAYVSVELNSNYEFDHWTMNGSVVQGASLSYSFVVTQNCQLVAHLNTVDAVNDVRAGNLRLFPNPVEKGREVRLDLPETMESAVIEVTDLLGRVVFSQQGDALPCISTAGLSAGVYTVHIRATNGTMLGKLVVKE